MRALTTFRTPSSIDTLAACLEDDECYFACAACAEALGDLVDADGTDFRALHKLIRFVRSSRFEAGVVRPNDFGDLAGYHCLKACAEALGTCGDGAGFTPQPAIDLLLELLEENDNTGNDFEDGYYLGALLRALAATRCATAGASRRVVEQIRRYLRLDSLLCSHDRVLTRAALQALVAVELSRVRRADSQRRSELAEEAGGLQDGGREGAERGAEGGAAAQIDLESAPSSGQAPSSVTRLPPISWATYLHYERYGECASLRLAAADCLLRLYLLAPAEAIESAIGEGPAGAVARAAGGGGGSGDGHGGTHPNSPGPMAARGVGSVGAATGRSGGAPSRSSGCGVAACYASGAGACRRRRSRARTLRRCGQGRRRVSPRSSCSGTR